MWKGHFRILMADYSFIPRIKTQLRKLELNLVEAQSF